MEALSKQHQQNSIILFSFVSRIAWITILTYKLIHLNYRVQGTFSKEVEPINNVFYAIFKNFLKCFIKLCFIVFIFICPFSYVWLKRISIQHGNNVIVAKVINQVVPKSSNASNNSLITVHSCMPKHRSTFSSAWTQGDKTHAISTPIAASEPTGTETPYWLTSEKWDN